MKKIYKGGALALMLAAGMFSAQAAESGTTPTGSNLFAFLGYSETNDNNGWYSITPEGEMNLLWLDQKFGMMGSYFNIGWVKDNRLCGTYGNVTKLFYFEFDINTGAVLVENEIDHEGANHYRYMLTGAYNPTDDYVYGFSFNLDRSIDYLVKAPAGHPEKTEIIRQMPSNFVMCKSVCYNPTDNHFYGIDTYNGIIRFDVYGNFEYITDIDLPGKDNMAAFSSAMVYSPKDKCYFWDAQYGTYYSDFVRIDPVTFHCEIMKEYPFLDLITILCCNDDDGMVNGPAAPKMLKYGIEGSALSGSITYEMPFPSKAPNEGAISEMTWTATEIPGGETQTGTCMPGETFTVNYKDLKPGEHTFSCYATNGDLRGASVFTNVWVGPDVPYVPQDVVLKEKDENTLEVTWKPVTHGAHDGSINISAISYAVFIDGEQKTVTKECSAEIEFDGEAPNRTYTASVVAFCDGLQSEAGVSNQIVAGAGYPLPFEVTPNEEEARLMTVINVDDDKSGWRYQVDFGESTFYTGYDYDNPSNDWLITPKLVLPSDVNSYSVSFEAKVHASNINEEYFDIWVSQENTAEGMIDIQVAPRTHVSLGSWEPFKFDFEVDAAGGYFVGIHNVSAADQRGWYLRNLRIEMNEAKGIDNINLLATVSGGRGEILINGLAGENVEVFSADGIKCAVISNASNEERIQAEAGIYVVKCHGESWKVAVR